MGVYIVWLIVIAAVIALGAGAWMYFRRSRRSGTVLAGSARRTRAR